MASRPGRKPARRPRIQQWIKIVLIRGTYLIVYGDELGQVTAFDQHGVALKTTIGTAGDRARRLADLLLRAGAFAGWKRL